VVAFFPELDYNLFRAKLTTEGGRVNVVNMKLRVYPKSQNWFVSEEYWIWGTRPELPVVGI
jgi:hypothetical protein